MKTTEFTGLIEVFLRKNYANCIKYSLFNRNFFLLSYTNIPTLWHDATKHCNSLNNHIYVKYRSE